MSDSANGLQINGNNESNVETIQTESTKVTPIMDSVNGQQSQTQQSRQQSSQVLIGQQVQQVPAIEVSTTDQNQLTEQSVQSCSSANSVVNVSISGSIISSNHSEPQNVLTSGANISSVVSSSMPPVVVSAAISGQGSNQTQTSQSQQLIVSSSQPQMVQTSQSGHLNMTNAIMGQSLTGTPSLPSMTSTGNAPTVQIAHQSPQHTPIIHTSVQPTQHNPMSVTMSQLPQVQVIQQPIGATPPTYQFQQVYQQPMILPSSLIGNMQFGAPNQGLSLQIPFTANSAVSSGTISGTVPITSIAAKPPIISKGVAISPLTQGITTSQHHMISPLKPNIGPGTAPQILKQVLPAQQFGSTTNQTVVIGQFMPHQTQHSMQQSILPTNANRTILETPKGKPFAMGSVRSSFGNKMLSHSGTIQPKSPILPASSSISSSLIANSHFKTPFPASGNATQLIATQTPSGLITNSPQILGSFQQLPQGLAWTTTPQSAHLMTPNGPPILIRAPGQSGEQHMFIQTSSPQIQTLSMGTPINVHSSGTTMQVNAAQTQSSPLTATPIATSLQPISVASNVNTTTTTTVANTVQPTAIAPAPVTTTPNKPRNIRPASSVATQTGTIVAQKQHAESSTSTPTPPKPIASAKPKPNSQTGTTISKSVSKEQTAPTPTRATSVAAATTQTISQQTNQHSTKTDASNQTTKVSVGTETTKSNNQVSSSRNSISDTNVKHSSVKSNSSTNTTTELSQSKVNLVAEEVKSTPTKRHVEKKDASTGQDSDLIATFFAQQQHNHQSVQNSAQVASNNVCQQNGQIAVLADLNRQDISKQPPQKAIVKPQILTHVIDGYIIQESPKPFPVNGLNYTSDQKSLNDDKNNTIIPIETIKSLKNKNENSLNTNASSSTTSVRNRSGSEPHLCLNCGSKRKISSKSNKKSKRFCSSSCADKYKNSDKNSATTRLGLYNSVTSHLENNEVQRGQDFSVESSVNESEKPTHEDRKRSKSTKKSHDNSSDFSSTKNGDINVVNSNQRKSTNSNDVVVDKTLPSVNSECQSPKAADEASSSSAVAGLYIPPGGKNPLKWSVQDVYEFVRNLQGCTEYADEFRSQEIDGQALMLLKEDHLMSAMNMKLGPALKICNKINALKEEVQKQN